MALPGAARKVLTYSTANATARHAGGHWHRPQHRARHEPENAKLETLRNAASELDRGRLLAQLIQVDRELTSHLSGAVREPLPRQQNRTPAEPAAARDDLLAHH